MSLTVRQRVRLGGFVVAGVAALLGSIVVLTGLSSWRPTQAFRARFVDSVSGLERGAPVKYQGLRVGTVESLAIAADEPRAIEVVMRLDAEVALYRGTRAVMDITGLTGLKSINLTAGDPRQPRLPAGALLPSGPSLFDQISDNVGAIVGDIKVVTERISHWFTDSSRERLESLLTNLDSLIGHVDHMLADSRVPLTDLVGAVRDTTVALGNTAGEARATLHQARHTLAHIEGRVDTTLDAVDRPLRDLRSGEVGHAVRAVRAAARSLEGRLSAEQTGEAIASLGTTLHNINQLVLDADMVVRSGREDFTASLAYLRQAAEDLREFSRILAQNPSVLVRGRAEEAE